MHVQESNHSVILHFNFPEGEALFTTPFSKAMFALCDGDLLEFLKQSVRAIAKCIFSVLSTIFSCLSSKNEDESLSFYNIRSRVFSALKAMPNPLEEQNLRACTDQFTETIIASKPNKVELRLSKIEQQLDSPITKNTCVSISAEGSLILSQYRC